MLCKHFNTPQGCSYGDKCQYAHGVQDLRLCQGLNPQNQKGNIQGAIENNKLQKNPLNYKIVKCKNWEQTGTCKYDGHCTFAHGNNELRTKADNLNQIQPSINNFVGQSGFMLDYNMNPFIGINNMNPQMQQQLPTMDFGQMAMNGTFDPSAMYMMGMNPQDSNQNEIQNNGNNNGNNVNPPNNNEQLKNEEQKEQ